MINVRGRINMTKFLKSFLIIISTVLLLVLSACSTSTFNKESSREDMWREDIEYLANKLPQKHKNLFFKKTKEEFEEELNYLKENINNLTDEEIKIGMRKTVASIGDAHTGVRNAMEDIFLINSYAFKDGIYVVNASEKYKDIIYKKILKVNDVAIEQVMEKLYTIIPHENEAQLKLNAPFFLKDPEILYGLKIIPDKTSMKLTLEDEKGNLFNKTITSINSKDIEKYDPVVKYEDEEKLPLYMRNNKEYYWYEYLKDNKTLYLNYNRCSNMKGKSFKSFTEEVLAFIDDNEVNKLVIDLRQNGGGNSMIFEPMIQEIMKDEKLNVKDSLFVIVGRRTFSSAILNAVDLRNHTNAVFLGEPTGGKPNHYGEVRSFELPNSKMSVSYSKKYFNHSKEDTPSFMPDKIIELTIEDFKNGSDPVMGEILKIE